MNKDKTFIKGKGLLLFLILCGCTSLMAESVTNASSSVSEGPTLQQVLFTTNNVWMMVATFLVFIMHLGFATLESGLTRAKNTTNILFKNVAIVAIGLLTYTLIGFNIMYPGDSWLLGKFFGFCGFGLNPPDVADMTKASANAAAFTYGNGGYTYMTDFLFQGMFAATAATIISGAVAERIKLGTFLIFTTIYVAVCYPIVGSWHWGGGWLADLGFHDFAGSGLVHNVGGWGALICAKILGPRTGKYINGSVKAIPGHSLPLATMGMFLLWLGWFGFNGGSVLSADPNAVSYVLVTTSLAAAAGVVSAMATSWMVQKKPDLTMILNGSLAGLVAITACADCVSIRASILIGIIAGVIVVLSVLFIDRKVKIDDPVGAISVHMVCGVWGLIATGIWGEGKSIVAQLIGVGAIALFCLATSGALFYGLNKVMGFRVEEEEEASGLDIGEHGMEAYGGFQIFSTQ